MRLYVGLFYRALRYFFADKCPSFAAAISYFALFSLFPLVLVVLSTFGFFLHSQSQRQSIVNTLFTLLGEGVDRNALSTQVDALAAGRGELGLIGLVLALWSASAVFGAIRTGLNAVWGVTKPRPYLAQKALDLAMVASAGLLLLFSLAVTGLLTAVETYSQKLLGAEIGPATHVLFAVLLFALPPSISLVAFALAYYIIPHARVRLTDVWLGALVAALLFQLVQVGFGIYVAKFADYDRIYGSLGTVIAFLFSTYLSANILLFGGEVTKQYVMATATREPPAPRRASR